MLLLLWKSLLHPFSRRSAAARSMSSAAAAERSHQRLFHLDIDPISGKPEWIVIEDGGEDNELQTTSKSILATTSYLDMLNDSRRNRAFRLAIDKTITKPCHVLDIGAGTGLLSMMAARAMGHVNSDGSSGSEGRVTACESYLPMVKLMRKVLRSNNMDRKIRVLNKRSDELEVGMDIPLRADVLVSEILDSELLGEGLIPTLQHAHDKLLVENPLTVPYKATTYGQLVECTSLWENHNLINREENASDGVHLALRPADKLCVKQKQYPMHCNSIKKEIKLLSEPFKIFDFDFWKRPDSSRETELHIKALNDGTVHAIISWWLLQLDKEGTIFYSTGPEWVVLPSDNLNLCPSNLGSGNWCDHWKQTVWFTPNTVIFVSKDEEVKLHAAHNETSISYEFLTSPRKDVEHHEIGFQDSELFLSPERTALYGDSSWRYLMRNVILRSLQHKVLPVCLVPDDSIFLTVAVANLSEKSRVVPLFPGIGKKGLRYLQAVVGTNNFTMDQIGFVKEKDLQLVLDEPCQRKVDLLIAEPFYYGDNNMLPWKNLRFWKDRTSLDLILSKDALIIPCRGFLKACAMYLPDLWQSRCCLTEIEGFDHSMVNQEMGACGNLPVEKDGPFLPFFIWQCGDIKILSEIVTILEFDFTKLMSQCSGKTKLQFREAGVCHGFVLWMDWLMDAEDGASVLSTGPDKRHWKQAVKLLRKPVEIGGGGLSIEIATFFDPTDGNLTIEHTLL